jgi:hypothetical protein
MLVLWSRPAPPGLFRPAGAPRPTTREPMRFAPLFASALLLTIGGAAALADSLAATQPLYSAIWIEAYLRKPEVKRELKITKDQEKRIRAALEKSIDIQRDDAAIRKITGAGKVARIRAYKAKRGEEALRSLRGVLTEKQEKRLKQIILQWWSVSLFDHPEIRKALQLGDKDVQGLREEYEQLKADVGKEIRDKGMLPGEAHRKFSHLAFGVPDRVRDRLTEAQRKKLKELLGPPHKFDP